MIEIHHRIIQTALKFVGVPYLWGGKGDQLWTPEGPRLGLMRDEHGEEQIAFDCSGYVTYCLMLCGLKDLRQQVNAKALYNMLSRTPEPGGLNLHYYGKSLERITHIAFAFEIYGLPYVLEAAGGDQSTTSIAEAKRIGAKVRCGLPQRRDYVGATQVLYP